MQPKDRAKAYAKQRGIILHDVGWGFNPTPKQQRRLQKKYTIWMRNLVKSTKIEVI